MAATDDDVANSSPEDATVISYAHPSRFHGADGYAYADNSTGASSTGQTWRQELPRWLASLNPGRTGREYEKAVRYFFDTPGVPEELPELSFDLLLAYRGALALRAAPRNRGAAYAPRTPSRTERIDAINGPRPILPLPASVREAGSGAAGTANTADTGEARPLAPATVNIRLTALRQFLIHCSMLGLLPEPELAPDRIRAALRRLPIEHRRPYQILDETEWEGFLRAALQPVAAAPAAQAAPAAPTHPVEERSRGPWGISRAVQQERAQAQADDTAVRSQTEAEPPESTRSSVVVKSHFGLTGARTAQRDHALVALALATGLRAIELSQLDLGDIQREWHDGHEEWWLILPDAKTKGQKGGRTLPLAPSLVETLMTYIRATGRKWENPDDQATPLFVSVYMRGSRGQSATGSNPSHVPARVAARLLAGQIARIVDRVETQWLAQRAEQASRDGSMQAGETRSISTHALRHSTAVALLAGNPANGRPPASVEHVRGWLGHFDIRTTQGYLAHLDARRHRRAFALAPGMGAATSAAMPPEPPDVAEPPQPDGDQRREDPQTSDEL